MTLAAPSNEIDSFEYVFLREINELEDQRLRVVVFEGLAAAESVTLTFGRTELTGCHPIRPSGRIFEIVWKSYIAYCVRNESYCGANKDDEIAVGKNFRVFSQSEFLNYISRATFATAEYPGHFQHYGVACQNHVIDVVSIHAQEIRQL
ncbi:MAG TPA: hypothetical protein VIH56_06495 [Candidatus Acidoferrales bacterium]|jgi:hypothetical protein